MGYPQIWWLIICNLPNWIQVVIFSWNTHSITIFVGSTCFSIPNIPWPNKKSPIIPKKSHPFRRRQWWIAVASQHRGWRGPWGWSWCPKPSTAVAATMPCKVAAGKMGELRHQTGSFIPIFGLTPHENRVFGRFLFEDIWGSMKSINVPDLSGWISDQNGDIRRSTATSMICGCQAA